MVSTRQDWRERRDLPGYSSYGRGRHEARV